MLSLTDNLKIHLGKNKHLNLIRPSFKKKKNKKSGGKGKRSFYDLKRAAWRFVCVSASGLKHSFHHQSLEAPQEPESPKKRDRGRLVFSAQAQLCFHTLLKHTHFTQNPHTLHRRPKIAVFVWTLLPPPLSGGSEGLLRLHRSCWVGNTNINTNMFPGGAESVQSRRC